MKSCKENRRKWQGLINVKIKRACRKSPRFSILFSGVTHVLSHAEGSLGAGTEPIMKGRSLCSLDVPFPFMMVVHSPFTRVAPVRPRRERKPNRALATRVIRKESERWSGADFNVLQNPTNNKIRSARRTWNYIINFLHLYIFSLLINNIIPCPGNADFY